jgi:hypothetical protein
MKQFIVGELKGLGFLIKSFLIITGALFWISLILTKVNS